MNNINNKVGVLGSFIGESTKGSHISNKLRTGELKLKPALFQDTVSFSRKTSVSKSTPIYNKYLAKPLNGNVIPFKGIEQAEKSEALKIANQINIFKLMEHINTLASEKMMGRGVGQKGIERAKEYIADEFKQYNIKPVEELGLNNYFQKFQMRGYHTNSVMKNKVAHGDINYYKMPAITDTFNILGMIKGSETPDEYLIITAHYDHLGKDKDTGIIYPGANDNASGVSAMLEIARIMSEEKPPKKSIIFAALSGEEFCCQGAEKLAKDLNEAGLGDKCEVLNIEMIGPKKGEKLDVWDQDKKGTENIVEHLKNAGQIFNTRVNVIRNKTPGQDSKKLNGEGIPSVCTAWDFKQKTNHPTYHTAEDKPNNINKKILKKAAKIIAAATYLVANKVSRDIVPKTPEKPKQITA